ncbi:carbohydrate ABC transporter permease, partial [Mesorhizobium sp. USDA-HM6]
MAELAATIDLEAAAASRRHFWSRFAIYGLLTVFAAIYLVPLLVVVLNSFREQAEIARDGLISLPRTFRLEAWAQAW